MTMPQAGVGAMAGARQPTVATSDTTAGLRLRGSGLSTYAGQRVQVVGTFVPAAVAQARTASVQEFRVTSIMPLAGACP
jgi:hypothetical protein